MLENTRSFIKVGILCLMQYNLLFKNNAHEGVHLWIKFHILSGINLEICQTWQIAFLT